MTTVRRLVIAAALSAGMTATSLVFTQPPAPSDIPRDASDPKSAGAIVVPESEHPSQQKKNGKHERTRDTPPDDAPIRSGVSGPKGARDMEPSQETPISPPARN